jgi:hypothetical protein
MNNKRKRKKKKKRVSGQLGYIGRPCLKKERKIEQINYQ